MRFSSQEYENIIYVKRQIQAHVAKMKKEPWAHEYVLPWNSMILSGGAIASLLQNVVPNDWDFYFTEELMMTAMKSHLEAKWEHVKDVDEKYQNVTDPHGKMITTNAITMKDDSSFITMFAGPTDFIKSTFDYVHCTPHYDMAGDTLYISPKQYRACVDKVLWVNNQKSITTKRCDKFLKRGYKLGSHSESNL